MNKQTAIAFIFFPLFCLIPPIPLHADEVLSNVLTEKAERLERPERMARLQPARIVKTLGIRPGMTILDIGAGSGFFSFQFADVLNGTGKVYATDIDPSMIEFMSNKAGDSGYENVVPVLVEADGVDPFYKQHQFDIIFVAGVYYHLWHHVDYFTELRPSLKNKGRLFILQPRNEVDFNESMFADFKVVMYKLRDLGDAFPVFQRLGVDLQAFIRGDYQEEVPPGIRGRIVEDFNRMLSDRTLLYDLLDYYYAQEDLIPYVAMKKMNEPQLPLIKWLAVQLDDNGVFSSKARKLADIDKRRLHRLNSLLLEGIFELRVRGGNPQNFYLEEKNSVIRKLKVAGYRFVRDYDFLDYYYLLEFKK